MDLTGLYHHPLLVAMVLITASGCSQTAAAPSPSRDPALWPFSTDSPWNTPIGSGALYADADDPCTRDLQDPSVVAWINAAEWSHPVYLATNRDPLTAIYFEGVLPVRIRIPANAKPAEPPGPDTDGHLHIIDPTRHFVDEMWQARRRPDGGWQASAYNRNDLYETGVGSGGTRAYGGSAIGGLIRRGELKTGIRHVLALALPPQKQRLGFVWPASSQDNFAERNYKGHVPMGQLVAIPPSVDIGGLGLGPQGLAIARALQDYGAYDVDSGAFTLYAEPPVEEELGQAREDMPAIRAHLRCVTNNRPDNVGGGGVRRAPPAPPLQ